MGSYGGVGQLSGRGGSGNWAAQLHHATAQWAAGGGGPSSGGGAGPGGLPPPAPGGPGLGPAAGGLGLGPGVLPPSRLRVSSGAQPSDHDLQSPMMMSPQCTVRSARAGLACVGAETLGGARPRSIAHLVSCCR